MPAIPALAQVLVVFAAVVVATARKVHLGLAAALGGLALALWRGLGPAAVASAALGEALSVDTMLLVGLMAFIMAFSSAMKKSGAMGAFSSALRALAPSPRIAMAVAPLLIGTLPMPGGAILSAPLVDSMDSERRRGAAALSAANYWFRHVLELAWPLYPAFILTSALTGIKADRLILLNAYAPPLLFCIGLAFILPARKGGSGKARADAAHADAAHADAAHADAEREPRRPLGARLADFAGGVAPLALVLALYVALDLAWKAFSPALGLAGGVGALVGRYGPIYLGLGAGCVSILRGPGGKAAFKGSVGGSTWRLIAVIVGIRVFSALLGAAGIAEAAAGELASAGIPAIVAIATLPFVAGIVTGVGFGYVGLAFPIVIGLAPSVPGMPFEAVIAFAAVFGYAGMMLSPLHVCMVVSAEHFGVGLADMMRRFALPLLAFAVAGAAYALALGAALAG